MPTQVLNTTSVLEHRYHGEHPLRTLWYLLKSERLRLFLAMLAYVVKHSPVWISPLLTARMIDVLVQHKPIAELWLNALLLSVLLFQNIPINFLYVRLVSLSVRKLEMRLRSALCRRLQHLSIGYYTRVSPGVLQTKVIRDVENVEQMVRNFIDGGVGTLSSIAGAITITAFRAPRFLPLFLLIVPVSAVVVVSLRRMLAERNQQFRKEIERMSASVSEMTDLIPLTRAHGLEETALERIHQTLSDVKKAGLEVDAGNALFGSIAWVTYNMFNGACLVVAAWAAYTGFATLTAGDVVMLSGFFGTMTNSVMGLVNLLPILSKGFTSIHSIGEVLESPDIEQNSGKTPVNTMRGALRFESVTFAYPDSDIPAVRDFSLDVSPGETIALVGPSGGGKSTVLKLVIGFIRPTSGRILLDGTAMESLDLRTYRQFLSVVPQETILFDGSVYENITYGLHNVSLDLVLEALRNANALEFVEKLPQGLATDIGERGAALSGGQKQRLAIARALLRNPKVLILDEATSALDTESEAQIQEALERLMKGRTTFVVAHRLSTIRNARRIVVMDQGQIVEIGSHAELLERNGLYARLQARQLE